VKALYVTDRAAIGDDRFRWVIAAISRASAVAVQLREKATPDLETLGWARRCRAALPAAIPLYVNRRFDIALAARADGVHLPADGLPPPRVRANTPRGFRIGVSTHSVSEAREAIADGADLIVIGPIFETPSKVAFGPPLSPEILGELPPASEHSADVFAIGGIEENRLDGLEPYRDRIAGVAGIRLFQEAADPLATAERIACR
jgi:thiamine-phosphate pyrophosphorylase